jgi:HSP20 family molecular chaperone IbpA
MSENTTTAKSAENARDEMALLPPTDVVEDNEGITLYADLPGVSKDKLKLQVEADTLTIEGEVSLDLPEGMESSHAEVGLSR